MSLPSKLPHGPGPGSDPVPSPHVSSRSAPSLWRLLGTTAAMATKPKHARRQLKVAQIPPAPKRVFINDLDSYASRNIGQCLSKHTLEVDATTDKDEEKVKQTVPSYPIVGTMSEGAEEDPPYVLEAYKGLSGEEIVDKVMECDIIIYNITHNPQQIHQASWLLSALHDKISLFTGPKMFILISTVMTWTCSEPITADDQQLPFTDDDFRRRLAHPNFQEHLQLEKKVAKLGRSDRRLFATYVVASGLQYGMGENVFHLFFKMSWLGQGNTIPVFGDGTNIVPTIHINDLASVIQKIIELRPNPYYLLAVDCSNNTMEDIVKAIAVALGPGTIQKKPFEEAFLEQDLNLMEIDLMRINLLMEATHLKELASIRWLCEFGLVENIELVVEEYRQIRGLVPIRICVLGPPAVGKSSVCQQICGHYKLHHIRLSETVAETISHLENTVRNMNSDAENEESTAATETQELLNSLKDNMEQNGGTLDDHLLVKVMVDKLMSNPCKNQGYVLDGFPKTYEQAKELLHVEEPESEDRPSMVSLYNKKIVPEFVVCLDASDDFLKDLVIKLPEKLVQEHKYEQENFLKNLSKYRETNMEEETLLKYFEELDITCIFIDVSGVETAMDQICDGVGQPRNYDSTEVQEEGAMHADSHEEDEDEDEEEEEDLGRKEVEDARKRSERWEKWSKALEEKSQWEVQQLEVLTVPMKKYLIDTNIMATISQGLIACGAAWPDDPVDFLAEYLMKNNP
ncbi:adenylate kinase 7-like isoform X1 [Entelurus aequoreus]|uniref:adenylate kinase 7-like isoform X1 n=1 Tax=Entelurus aequoreus TaxID=161455 RepID=UPI002B1E5963|nr:adenylate kinase 7-like isoform X1 [Entelurus aequoreus]